MKKSTFFLIVLVAIFFTSTLVLLYLNLNKRPTTISTPTIGTIPTETPTSDPTADWKTYTSSDFGFSIDYPQDLQIQNFMNDQYNRTVSFKGSDIYFSITLRKTDSSFNLDKYYFMDSLSVRTTTMSGQKANVYEMPNGYCDGPGCSQPYIAIVTEHNNDVYSISFFGDSKLSSLESQILSTFKFINQIGSPTPTATSSSKPTAAKILTYNVPSTWLTTADDLNLFQISYDPNLYSPVISAQRISLSSKGGGLDLDIKLLPYDGGSRHSFISQNIGFRSLPSTQEIEYSYGGKSGLILYGVEASGSNTVGMIIANNSKAWLIESQTPGQQLIEKQISTLMLR